MAVAGLYSQNVRNGITQRERKIDSLLQEIGAHDPDFIPHTAFDQHVIVGGRFFDVLDGQYEIELLPGNRCRLHLTSRHRLTTRFNAYAGWWSARIMNAIQGSILEVMRAVIPMLLVQFVGVLLITYVPWLTTWLPGLFK